MIARLRQAWTWWIGGLAEALLWAAARLRPVPCYRLEVGDTTGRLFAPDEGALGDANERGSALHVASPDLAARLAGKAVDIVIPSAWMVRRDLGSVPAQSVPFLDAYVRHRLERLTPWRAADVFYRIDTFPDPAAPDT